MKVVSCLLLCPELINHLKPREDWNRLYKEEDNRQSNSIVWTRAIRGTVGLLG